jgi:GT2 family glycosyltransferase
MILSRLRIAAARLPGPSHPILPTAARVPLAALRARLDQASLGSSWELHPEGVFGRALLMPAGTTFTLPLSLSAEVFFSARAMLLPHDWSDARDGVVASVKATDADRREHTLWSGTLWTRGRGKPRGLHVDCRLPAASASLQLRIRVAGEPRERSVARAIWWEPGIIDRSAPALARSVSAAPRDVGPLRAFQGPLISVLTPVHDPPADMLKEAIASVLGQTFSDWELCLVDDGSTDPEVVAMLKRYASADSRIRLARRETAGGISSATNAGLDLATGRYIALLDHDDALTPDALQLVADRISAQPGLDMIYSDEDVVGENGGLIEHHPKPGWSPEQMSARMYTCHLGVYKRMLAVELGGFQSKFDGCQDYDFVLRLMERTDRIAHIPRYLYHWRAHAMSTAGADAKPQAYLAQPAAIASHLERSRVDAKVQFAHLPGIHRIVHRVEPSTGVDLVLAIRDVRGLAEAAVSWLAQAHPSWRIVLAAAPDAIDAAMAALASAGIQNPRVEGVHTRDGAHPAASLKAAAEAATGDHLLLMEVTAAGLTHDWLTRLIGYSSQPQIAAAGPVVLTADGRIQHGGVALPEGIPLYLHHGSPASASPPAVYNLSALSGVLATRRETYRQLGGLNPHFQELALIEYCLRATEAGNRVVLVPDARLRATGSDITANDLPAIWRLRQRWNQIHTRDRYYNPNYRTDRGDFGLAEYG